MTSPSATWRLIYPIGRVLRVSTLLVTGVTVGLACGGDSTIRERGGSVTAVSPALDPQTATPLERLTAAYHDEKLDPPGAAWSELVADEGFDTKPIAIAEFVRLRPEAGALQKYDVYLAALAQAVTKVGGEITVNDTLMPGLDGLEGYAGGASWVATLPTIRAYVDVVLDESVVAAARERRAAISDAQVLAGPNLVPDLIKNLPPNVPASNFPSGRVAGKSPQEIVDALLAIYPSGGADPPKQTLESLARFDGFADQRVHFINLYRFNDVPGGGSRGAR